MSVRTSLVTALKEIVGDDAVVIEYEDNKDVLGQMTVQVKQRTIARLPQAPSASLRFDYVLTITAPAIDPAVAEPALDDFVPSFLAEMTRHSWFGWDEATKVLDGQNLAYEVNAYVVGGPTGEEQ